MKKIVIILLIILSIAIFYSFKYILPQQLNLNKFSFSQAVYDQNQKLLRLTLTTDQKYRLYMPLDKISPLVMQATLLQEDQFFYWHPGVNPIALVKAGWETFIIRKRQIGASTITMQLARLYFNINSKSISGKIQQIYRALELEFFYSKNQILEAYLNLAPYGGNIEGIGAASLIYYDKNPQQLTLPEAITLAVIPQNPVQRSPFGKHLTILETARLKLFYRWIESHPQDQSQEKFLELPPQFISRNLPFLAPHFVDMSLQNNTQPLIQTTLDLKLQNIVDQAAKNYLLHFTKFSINNYAVMLVDTRDMSVKALIGSADFYNAIIHGQVNGTLAKRSPGSTLKPFIYAIAIDQGLIHPYSVLQDAPTNFGAYTPENFDNDFMGPVKAKNALILSRNIPAIYLADQLKTPTFYQFLQEANISRLKSEKNYGLSLVLGGAEVNMQELISLYAMLANQGIWRPIRTQLNDPLLPGKQLLSPEASYLTLDMLKDTPRPSPVSNFIANQLPVYWKTGTSSGYRDAWSVGIFGPYALAVWVGDFQSKSNPAYIGTVAAAPLFFNIIDAVAKQTGPLPQIMPDPTKLNLTRVPICEASGMLPSNNNHCPNIINTWFIPGRSPIKTDTVYREIAINKNTGLRTCHYDENTIWQVYEFWPSDLLKIFTQAGIQRKIPPEFEPGCNLTQASNGVAPKIISPQAGLIYSLSLSHPENQNIIFSASADADVKKIFWFINNEYIGAVSRDQNLLWQAKPGKYQVRVIDDQGRAANRTLIVENTN